MVRDHPESVWLMEAHRPFFVLHRLLSCPSQQLPLRPKTDFLPFLYQSYCGCQKKGENFSWWFQPSLSNIDQIGIFPEVGVKIKNIWNHDLVTVWKTFWWGTENSRDPKNIPIICPKAMQLRVPKKLFASLRWWRKALAQHFCSPWGLGETKLSEKGVNCYTWTLPGCLWVNNKECCRWKYLGFHLNVLTIHRCILVTCI